MTTFSALGYSYESEDKDFEYPPQILDEPFSDFFDQYLTQTLSDIGDHGCLTRDADLLDFFTDGDTTSSASYATDSTSSVPSHTQYNILQERSRQEETLSLSKTAFVPQNYHSRRPREKLVPAVSGLELLLDIEGRANTQPHCSNPPYSAPATLTSLPLRRKPRFKNSKSKDLRDRNYRVSTTSILPINESPDMVQSLYHHQVETPHSQEWTQKLEQPESHTASKAFPLSPPTAHILSYYDDIPDDSQIPPHMSLREQFFRGEERNGQEESHIPTDLDHRIDGTPGTTYPMSQQTKIEEQDITFDGFHEYIQSLQLDPTPEQRQLYHASSWEPSATSSSDLTYTLSTDQVAATWNHGLPAVTNSCYSHHHASKSAPALPFQLGAADSFDFLTPTSPGREVVSNQDAAGNGTAQQSDPYSIDVDACQYPPLPTPDSFPLPAEERSQGPPRRTSSPAARTPVSHTRRRSKSAQRRKSAGNLKTPKSPASMGFVNFTPSDSKRILTGVAPSGSSKTKARREQEANEKKRKLSLAVLRAVEEAGGDPEPLRREGLFIDG